MTEANAKSKEKT